MLFLAFDSNDKLEILLGMKRREAEVEYGTSFAQRGNSVFPSIEKNGAEFKQKDTRTEEANGLNQKEITDKCSNKEMRRIRMKMMHFLISRQYSHIKMPFLMASSRGSSL